MCDEGDVLRCLASDLRQTKDPDQHLAVRGSYAMWNRVREEHVA